MLNNFNAHEIEDLIRSELHVIVEISGYTCLTQEVERWVEISD